MSTLQMPPQLPVMVIPHCTFLPHGLLPLYIFEEKYRALLKHTLAGDRMFALAMPLDDEEGGGVSAAGTVGMIRACVRNPDGTSHLLLQGMQRVHYDRWHEDSIFPMADVTPITTEVRDPDSCRQLAAKLVQRACALADTHGTLCQQLRQHLSTLEDPEPVADIIAYNFIRCPAKLQRILEEPWLDARLEQIDGVLGAIGS